MRQLFAKGNKLSKGRPKGSGMVQIARDWAVKKGWVKLIEIAEGKGWRVENIIGGFREIGPTLQLQLEATKLLLAYGIGKPTERHEITGVIERRMVVVSTEEADKETEPIETVILQQSGQDDT